MALSPQDLFEIRKIIVSAKLVDSGAFDAEIKRMEDSIATQNQVQLDTLTFQEQKSAKRLQAMQDAIDEKQTAVDEQMLNIEGYKKELAAKQQEANETIALAKTKMLELETVTSNTQADIASQLVDLESRVTKVESQEKDLAAREQALVQAQQDLATKLQTIKSLSA